MPRMTEEEAWALDEEVTRNPPRVDPLKARHVSRMVAIDDFSAEYLMSVSTITHKTPSEIIGEMVRERAAVSAVAQLTTKFLHWKELLRTNQLFLAGGRASSLRRYWRGLPMQPRQSVRRQRPRHRPPQGACHAAVRHS